MSRLSFNFEGHWPVAKNMEQEAKIAADKNKFHPQELGMSTDYSWVTLDRLSSLCLRAIGVGKMPGKAPIGGLAYAIRGKQ